MAMSIKAKRASGPLDDTARARLLLSGYASSGSEHDAGESSCLPTLVHAFFDLDDPNHPNKGARDDDDDSDSSSASHAVRSVRGVLDPSGNINPFLLHLRSNVLHAAKMLAGLKPSGSSVYRHAVMARLSGMGYNAGVCKARWESSSNLIAGNYEYIDVNHDETRYIVDLDFVAQFEIARATPDYERLVASLPAIMVARAEEVRRLVRMMAGAAKRSLRSMELSVPPWRMRQYMIAKWFGPYRRTVNRLPCSAGAPVNAATTRGDQTQCGVAVGFNSATRRLPFVAQVRGR